MHNLDTILKILTFNTSGINGVAIIPFMFANLITWPQVIIMSFGGALGGYLCAHFARRLEPSLVRKFVIVLAFGMTTYFFIHG
ncbi:MAG: TSUP family transporter [Nostocales cyanobacterium ELA608]